MIIVYSSLLLRRRDHPIVSEELEKFTRVKAPEFSSYRILRVRHPEPLPCCTYNLVLTGCTTSLLGEIFGSLPTQVREAFEGFQDYA